MGFVVFLGRNLVLTCSGIGINQIWLNLLVDDCQFGYITKLRNKNPDYWMPKNPSSLVSIRGERLCLQLW
jgi:hypothetical protein